MREFESSFDEGLRKGLRHTEVSTVKEQQLVECRNLRPCETGLRPIAGINNPFVLPVAWPFPQIIVGSYSRLLVTANSIYNCATWATTLAYGTLTGTDPWDIADFNRHILMTNGAQVIQRSGDTLAWGPAVGVPLVRTVCAFRGQAFAGGVFSEWYDCRRNYVIWSDIGSLSFVPTQRNEAGYTVMPFRGDVLRVLPLDDMVVVYGSNGIVALKPAEQYLGMAELSKTGIPWKGAVGGGTHSHVFVDFEGFLWKIESGGKLTKLGYQEYMTQLSAGDIMVSYSQAEDEFYISDGVKCFVLTRWGLCQAFQLVTSLAYVEGDLVGVYVSDGDLEGRVVTDVMDFGIRSFKTVSAIEVGGFSSAGLRACVDWRSDISGTFQRSEWLVVNPTGFASPIVTANDFRLCVKSSSYTDMELRYIISRVKNVDRRAMRGVPTSGAGLRR